MKYATAEQIRDATGFLIELIKEVLRQHLVMTSDKQAASNKYQATDKRIEMRMQKQKRVRELYEGVNTIEYLQAHADRSLEE